MPHKTKIVLTAGLFLFNTIAMAQTCSYDELDLGSCKLSIGNFSLDLGESDGDPQPTAWMGPISIGQEHGSTCTVTPDVSIMERPIFSDGKHLMVTTYSGSHHVVYIIDQKSCNVLWKSEKFWGNVKLHNKMLHMADQQVKLGSDCLPKKK
jgi:hypothetical protein